MNIFLRVKKAIGIWSHYYIASGIDKIGTKGTNSKLLRPADLKDPSNIHLGNNVLIGRRSTIMTTGKGRFVVGDRSTSAEGLLVVCSTHNKKIGEDTFATNSNNIYYTIEVGEEVWIGANVTLLPGTEIGRGAIVGAGTVVRSKVPPYAIVTGNPAKVIGFSFTPEEIIEHEKALYPEEERLPLELLEKNYEKYFLKRLKEIKEFTRL